jgi:hypothetical protein
MTSSNHINIYIWYKLETWAQDGKGHTAFFAKNNAGVVYFSNISSAVLSVMQQPNHNQQASKQHDETS